MPLNYWEYLRFHLLKEHFLSYGRTQNDAQVIKKKKTQVTAMRAIRQMRNVTNTTGVTLIGRQDQTGKWTQGYMNWDTPKIHFVEKFRILKGTNYKVLYKYDLFPQNSQKNDCCLPSFVSGMNQQGLIRKMTIQMDHRNTF